MPSQGVPPFSPNLLLFANLEVLQTLFFLIFWRFHYKVMTVKIIGRWWLSLSPCPLPPWMEGMGVRGVCVEWKFQLFNHVVGLLTSPHSQVGPKVTSLITRGTFVNINTKKIPRVLGAVSQELWIYTQTRFIYTQMAKFIFLRNDSITDTLVTSRPLSSPTHLLKGPHPNTITLRFRILAYEFVDDTNTISIIKCILFNIDMNVKAVTSCLGWLFHFVLQVRIFFYGNILLSIWCKYFILY